MFADAPDSTFDQVETTMQWNEPVLEAHQSWLPSKSARGLPTLLSTALHESWADAIASSQTGPTPTHQHLSDTTERLFRELNQWKMNHFKHRSGFCATEFPKPLWSDPITAYRRRHHYIPVIEMNFKNCCRALLPSLLILDRSGSLRYEAQTAMNYLHSSTKWRSHRNVSSRGAREILGSFFC